MKSGRAIFLTCLCTVILLTLPAGLLVERFYVPQTVFEDSGVTWIVRHGKLYREDSSENREMRYSLKQDAPLYRGVAYLHREGDQIIILGQSSASPTTSRHYRWELTEDGSVTFLGWTPNVPTDWETTS